MVASRRRISSVSPLADKSQHNVPAHNHAEIAVNRIHRVHEECGRSDRTEGGRDLAGDDAALAHAGDDDAPAAGVH